MSVSTGVASVRGRAPLKPHRRVGEPVALRALELGWGALVVGVLAWVLAVNWEDFTADSAKLLPWLLIVVAADLLPVPIWGSVELMMSFPILLALSLVFPPYAAGLVALVGTVDIRELRREISIGRGFLNRSTSLPA